MSARRELWTTRVILILLALLTGFVLVSTKRESAENKTKIITVCRSFASVGNLDVATATTKTGVAVIVEHRNASIHLGCGDLLISPSPLLRRLATQFNIDMEG